MLLFFACVAALITGYIVYGTFVDKIFGSSASRLTPAITKHDGVDYVKMSPVKIFLIQLLNIAGLGPIFGPILGALYGPSALIWIVLGSIIGGAVHDYFSGMMSMRDGGSSIPDVVGNEMGNFFKQFMRVFSIVLLLLVGIVFVLGPAKLLGNMFNEPVWIWVTIIFVYYFLATILPVDKLIGKLYPFFGATLLFMAIGLTVAFMFSEHSFYPNLTLSNLHPDNLSMWPLMFITIACGAVSGFHATQSPMMARCITNEKYGKPVFYGSMIGESVIALIWATLGMSFYHSPEELNTVLAQGGPALVVNNISTALLGGFGGILAVIGVIALPVTSGDTAFRSARLIIADFLKLEQKAHIKRLMIAVPLFIVGFLVSQMEFGVIWRYFGWANQALATIVLWSAAAYLIRRDKFHYIATIPAIFMTTVVFTYLFNDKIGFGMDLTTSTIIGIIAAIISTAAFFIKYSKGKCRIEESAEPALETI
ncbi:MAG: carbon starvation protein A [Candidatus Delongbacteria bacterium]|nr:carbon starvation protein A [Candidatus Delongbacteria bacterium]MBN2835628.1 carbon starvation protein A [Candidatus Delongbacteria bacterium]